MTLAVSASALGALLAKAESGDLKEVVYKTLANVDFTRSAYNAHFVMKLSVGFASCTLTSDDVRPPPENPKRRAGHAHAHALAQALAAHAHAHHYRKQC